MSRIECEGHIFAIDSSEPLRSLRGHHLVKEHCRKCGHKRTRISKKGETT